MNSDDYRLNGMQKNESAQKSTARPPKKLVIQGFSLAWMQMVICAALVAGIICCRHITPALYQSIQRTYTHQLSNGLEFWSEYRVIQFSDRSLEVWAGKLKHSLQQCLAQQPALIGQGAGNFFSFKKKAPQGCSLEFFQSNCQLSLPVEQYTLTSSYGWRSDPILGEEKFHKGCDLAASEGTLIYPVLPGIVQKSGWSDSYGNYILIQHSDGTSSKYSHLQYVFVRTGQAVKSGDCLGTVGQTGQATGPHLHLELYKDGVCYNPEKALENAA